MSNITQVVRTDKHMTTLKKTIIATNLDQVLSSNGPYTFFAPSDTAFAKLEANVVDTLLKPENCEKLSDLLNNHLVEGKINFKNLEDGQKLTTINGKELSVHVKNGTAHIGNAQILTADVRTSNGVIHCLDTVLN